MNTTTIQPPFNLLDHYTDRQYNGIIIADQNGVGVAKLWFDDRISPDSIKFAAHQMAASADLLASCKELLHTVKIYSGDAEPGSIREEQIIRALLAIYKAEGAGKFLADPNQKP